MSQHFIKFFLLIALITNLFAELAWANNKPEVQVTSFADIVEPLMPAVVNIYTIKYNKKRQSRGNPLPELIPFEEFKDFLNNLICLLHLTYIQICKPCRLDLALLLKKTAL